MRAGAVAGLGEMNARAGVFVCAGVARRGAGLNAAKPECGAGDAAAPEGSRNAAAAKRAAECVEAWSVANVTRNA